MNDFMKYSLALVIMGMGVLNTGCHVLDKSTSTYQTPTVAVPTHWLESAENLAQGSTSTVSTQWWLQYQDPMLTQLIETTITNNFDLRIAQARIEQVQAQYRINRSQLLPNVAIDAQIQRGEQAEYYGGGRFDTYQLALNAGYQLDIWGKIKNANDAALADLMSQQYYRDAAYLSLTTQVAQLYFQLLALEQQQVIAEKNYDLRQQSLTLQQATYDAGLTSGLDFSQQTADAASVARQVIELKSQIRLVKNNLALLSGVESNTIQSATSLEFLVTQLKTELLSADLIKQRPDIGMAEQQLQSAFARLQIAKKAYFPDINLTGNLGYLDDQFSALINSKNFFWQLIANLTAPIFQGGSIKATIEQRSAVEKEALINYERTVFSAYKEVEDALIAQDNAKEQAEYVVKEVEALTNAAHLSRLNYDNGIASLLDAIDLERRQFLAELDMIQNVLAQLNAQVQLIQALGGGWQQ